MLAVAAVDRRRDGIYDLQVDAVPVVSTCLGDLDSMRIHLNKLHALDFPDELKEIETGDGDTELGQVADLIATVG